jgi:MazG family protein
MEDLGRFDSLVGIMDRLRDPGGCPWDLEQSFGTLRRYLVEECAEVADALDQDDPAALCEELGDLLFQIVFLSRLAQEQGRFSVADVVRGIAEKMIRRHPHVFGTVRAETAQDVVRNWDEIKQREKGPRSVMAGIPAALSPMLKAQQIGERAARVGFDWPDAGAVLDKAEEELSELRAAMAAGDADAVRAEIGDVLFTMVMLSRRSAVDPEAALAATNRKFLGRFARMEQEAERRGLALAQIGADELEALWNAAKAEAG